MCIKGTGLNQIINSLSLSEVQVLLLRQVCAMVAGGGCKLLRGQWFVSKLAINTSASGLVSGVGGCRTCAYLYIQTCIHMHFCLCQAYAKWYH